MKKRIIVLTQWFEPEPAYRGKEFVRNLVATGYEVEVVTGFPNYPGGDVYDGYRIRPITHTQEDGGYALTRLALYPSHDASKIGRILNYTSFFMSALIYLSFVARRAHLVYVYHPPLTVGLAAAFSKYLRRWPVVVEIQDLWPDTLKATGMIGNDKVLKVIGWWARWMYGRVDHLIVQSWGFRDRVAAQGVPAKKITMVINWANEATAQYATDTPNYSNTHTFRVLFAGNIGRAQALGSVIEAAESLRHARPEVGFYFLGEGLALEGLIDEVRARGLTNVTFWPRVSAHEVGSYLDGADALLVHLADDPLFAITIPSKTQAYLYAGKPILMGVRGDAARLVKTEDAGRIFTPENVESMVAAIEDLASMSPEERDAMGQRGRDFYNAKLSRAMGFATFIRIFDSLIEDRAVSVD